MKRGCAISLKCTKIIINSITQVKKVNFSIFIFESMHDQNFPVDFIMSAFSEDIGDGDHSTLSCIDPSARGKAILKIKEDGIIAGIDIARSVFKLIDPDTVFNAHRSDGDRVCVVCEYVGVSQFVRVSV
jgi:hypothetical protein